MKKLFILSLISSIALLSYATPPVSLLTFDVTATVNGHNAFIQWSTEGEVENHYFEIQRSRNGSAWVKIGIVKATETASATNYYEFMDRNPQIGTNYYRLVQVDFDETTEAFGSASVFIEPRGEFSVYPVPMRDFLTIGRTPGGSSEITEVRIFDITGRLVYSDNPSGEHENIILSDLKLENGSYLLSFKVGDEWVHKNIVANK